MMTPIKINIDGGIHLLITFFWGLLQKPVFPQHKYYGPVLKEQLLLMKLSYITYQLCLFKILNNY